MLATSKKMKIKLNIILIISTIILFLNSCNHSKITKKELTEKAIKITEILNENNIDVFRKWNFEYRGKAEIWKKKENNSVVYKANYTKENDSIKIYTFIRFLNSEFPCKIDIDTTIFKTHIIFQKSNNEKIKIEAQNNKWENTLIGKDLKAENVFIDNNPFKKLKLLSSLKDKLKVYRISSYQQVGDFIEFDIGNGYVLTYISSYSNFNPDYKEVWFEKFSKGNKIREKWNLRKLETPRDNR
jgi:hypothetical protein